MTTTVDYFRRLEPKPHRHGILMPQEQSFSHWGVFRVPGRVEIIELHDQGETPFGFVSLIVTDKGKFTSATTRDYIEDYGPEAREKSDMAAIALHFGCKPEEIELLE